MPERTPLFRPVALIATAATLSAIVALVVLEVSPTGLSSVSAAVSQWALTPYLWGYRWFTISLAVAGVAMGILALSVFARRRVTIAVCLFLFAFGRSFVGWVPMDAPGASATLHGDIHWALGIISFVTFIIAALAAIHGMAGLRYWDRVSAITGWIALVCVFLLVASQFAPALNPVFGLFERGFYVSALVWLAVASVTVLRGSAPRRR